MEKFIVRLVFKEAYYIDATNKQEAEKFAKELAKEDYGVDFEVVSIEKQDKENMK